jgi:hypothetical protein
MVLIPPDAALRLRLQTETNLLQPVQPTHEIPGELPGLQPGQAFMARIQEALPDNLYKALVAGKALTLQLPEGAKSGDLLELVVVDRTPSTIVAQRADSTNAAAAAAAEPYPYATLSRAAQMIGQLLLPEGETPQPATLNRGQPILQQPPANADVLVPNLAKAVSDSGLFYEAHQSQWLAGQRTTEALLQEPQARAAAPEHAPANTASAAAASPASSSASSASATHAAASAASPSPPSLLQALFGGGEKAADASAPQQQAANLAQSVPEQLRPLVQQQLDTIATQRMVWHGEVWPGQTMDWEIEREKAEQRQSQQEEQAPRWSTALRLTMPRLGSVSAVLQLAPEGLRVRLTATDAGSAADLRQGGPALAQALATAGLRPTSIEIGGDNG